MRPPRFTWLPVAVLATTIVVSGIADAQTVHRPTWTPRMAARGKAASAKLGIVYYRSPELGSLHTMFTTESIAELSKVAPFVRIMVNERKQFQEEFGGQEKTHAIAVTDWHGNLIHLYQVKTHRDKLPVAKVVAHIRSAKKFVKNLEKKSARDLAKADKTFEKKQWARAIKAYVALAKLKGIDASTRATERLGEIVVVGQRQIADAQSLADTDVKAAITALKKIAKEFRGSVVETLADEAIKTIEGK